MQLWHISTFFLFASPEIRFAGVTVIISIIFLYRLAAFSTRKIFTWLTTFVVLFVLNVSDNFFERDAHLSENSYQDLIIAAHWTILRCISYNFDVKNRGGILENLSYCLYLPLFFSGPFIQFQYVKQSYRDNQTISLGAKIKLLILQMIRFYFWLLFTEIVLHYVYVNAIIYHPDFVKNLNNWSLYGYGYAMGQFFHLKYVVMYGIATSLAKFENIQTPKTPRCIGRVHLYSDMWRHFDVGLYHFLTK